MLAGLTKIFDVQVRFGLDNKAFLAGMKKVGASMSNAGRKMTMAVTLPILGLGVAAVKISADFEKTMNTVGAVTGATGKDFDALREKAKELGRTTEWSANQAAEGMKFLGMAGFKTNEILDALPSVLKLATAGEMDLAQSADIVTNMLTGMQMKVTELPHAVDVLSKTFTSANVDLGMLGESFGYAALSASSTKIPFEEVAAMFGLMGNAGLQASRAGTAFRAMVNKIASPSERGAKAIEVLGISFVTAKGDMRSMIDIMSELRETTKDMGSVERKGVFKDIFGVRGGETVLAMLATTDEEFQTMVSSVTEAHGEATRIQQMKLRGLHGQLTLLKSAAEGFAIAIGESGILGAVTELVMKMTPLIQKMAQADPEQLQLGLKIAAIAAALGPVLWILGQIILVAPAVATACTFIFGPWGLLIAAIVAGVILIIKNWGKIKPLFQAAYVEVMKWMEPIKKWFIDNSQIIKDAWQSVVLVFVALWDTYGPLLSKLWEAHWIYMKTIATAIWETIKIAFTVFFTLLGGILKAAMQAINGDWSGAWLTIKETFIKIWEDIELWIGKMILNIERGFLDFTDSIKNGFQDLWHNLVGGSIVIDIVRDVIEQFGIMETGVGIIIDRLLIKVEQTFEQMKRSALVMGLPAPGSGVPARIKDTDYPDVSDEEVKKARDKFEASSKNGEKYINPIFEKLGNQLTKQSARLGKMIAHGNIGKALERVFTMLGNSIAEHIQTRITAMLQQQGMSGFGAGLLGGLGGGLVGVGIGLLGGLMNKGNKVGETSDLPIFAHITNWEGYFQFGATMSESFFRSGRSDIYATDAHGRVMDHLHNGWEGGEQFSI